MASFTAFVHRQFIYEPPVPTASFERKTVIVTGSNVGLGREATRWIVRLGASQVILACRNTEKGKAAAKEIQESTACSDNALQVWHLDMSSYASVIAFADRARAELPRLDVLIANAGVAMTRFGITEDNEETITTNCVSTALLALLLHPKLQETAKAYNTQTHITATGSELHEAAKFKERKAPNGKIFEALNDKRNFSMTDRYDTSKLLEWFVIKQIASLSPVESSNVIVNCVAPGWCKSELGKIDSKAYRAVQKVMCRPTEVGARTIVYGASIGAESHGKYVPDCKITPVGGLAKGEEGEKLQKRVWSELREKLEKIKPGVTSLA